MNSAEDIHFKGIFERIATGIAVANLEGGFEDCNPAYTELTGYTLSELRTKRVSDLVHLDDLEPYQIETRRLLSGESTQFELISRCLHKSGKKNWVRNFVSILPSENGGPAHVLAVVTNISKLRLIESELRDSEQRLRLFVDHAPVALAMFDRDMRYLNASRRWISDHQLEGQEIIGRSHYEMFPQIPERWKQSHAQALAGAVVRAEEDSFTRSDGSQQWSRWEVHPWFNAAGDVGGIVIFTEEITGRKNDERRIRESEARYRAIVLTAIDGIVVIGEDGIVQSINPAMRDLFGYAPEEIVGQNIKLLMAADVARRHDSFLKSFKRGGVARIPLGGRELEARRKDGSMFAIELSVSEWSDADGRRVFTGVLHDISERKRIEKELANARRVEALGQLASGVVHDFNNLLAIILGNLELAKRNIQDRGLRTRIRQALNAVQTGKALNQRLLSLTGLRKLRPRALDLNERARGVMSLLRFVGDKIVIKTDLAQHLHPVFADAFEVDCALINLAKNSSDAMPQGGEILIQTRLATPAEVAAAAPDASRRAFVRLSLSDTGVGMSEQVRQHAMDPFFSTKGRDRGTGLGLSSVYSFARQTGGFVTIASKEGQGTTVSVFLPCSEEETAAGRNGRPAFTGPFGDGEVVLVVEDDEQVREVTVKQLEVMGYVAMEADCASRAKEILLAEPAVQLVLTDLKMPGNLSGLDLAHWVRLTLPRMKILIATALNEVAGAAEAAADGIPILEKPYTKLQLARAVHDALEFHPA